jgi:ribosomal protein L31
MSTSIKDLDETAFRNLKAEAAREGIKIGDAASEAFRMWVASKRHTKLQDKERMFRAANDMDRLRAKFGKDRWSGVDEIRKWRELRK